MLRRGIRHLLQSKVNTGSNTPGNRYSNSPFILDIHQDPALKQNCPITANLFYCSFILLLLQLCGQLNPNQISQSEYRDGSIISETQQRFQMLLIIVLKMF